MTDLGFIDAIIQSDCQSEHTTREEAHLLWGVGHDARWLGYHAANLTRHAKGLRVLPEFDTRAEDELKKAELQLMEALNEVRETKKLFEECE